MFGLTDHLPVTAQVYWFRQLSQSTAFDLSSIATTLRLYGTGNRVATGLLFSGRSKTTASTLRVCRHDDGRGLDHDKFTWRDYWLAAEIFLSHCRSGLATWPPRAQRIRSALIRVGLAFD